jgi:hypothetical protein
VIRNRRLLVEVRQLRRGPLDAAAPGWIGVAIGRVDAPAGEHMSAAPERRAFVPANEEDFRAG